MSGLVFRKYQSFGWLAYIGSLWLFASSQQFCEVIGNFFQLGSLYFCGRSQHDYDNKAVIGTDSIVGILKNAYSVFWRKSCRGQRPHLRLGIEPQMESFPIRSSDERNFGALKEVMPAMKALSEISLQRNSVAGTTSPNKTLA